MLHWLGSLGLAKMPSLRLFGAAFIMDREKRRIVMALFLPEHLYLGGHCGLNDDLVFRALSVARYAGLSSANLLPNKDSPTIGVYHWPEYVICVDTLTSEGTVVQLGEARRLLGKLPEVQKVIIPEAHQLVHLDG